MTLSEFEARCRGHAPGEITPKDVINAIRQVEALGESYRDRLVEKANAWRTPQRTFNHKQASTFISGMERSMPTGDL